jgi:hypothetical protein
MTAGYVREQVARMSEAKCGTHAATDAMAPDIAALIRATGWELARRDRIEAAA